MSSRPFASSTYANLEGMTGTTSLFARHAVAGIARKFTYNHRDALAMRPAASEGEHREHMMMSILR